MTSKLYEIGETFSPDRCTECGICLSSCPISALPIDESKKVMAEAIKTRRLSAPIARCMLHAVYCNLVCPEGANPVGLFREIKDMSYKKQGISGLRKLTLPSEKAFICSLVREALPENEKKVMLRSFNPPESAESLLWLGCNLSQIMPYLVESTTLFEGMPIAGGPEFCCGDPYLLQGDLRSYERQANKLATKLREMAVKRMISVCPGCYVMTHDAYPKTMKNFNIKVDYFFEYLWERYLKGELKFEKLNLKVFYQEPCVFRKRNYPDLQDIPKRLMNAMGVQVVVDWKRCCGSPILYTSGELDFSRELATNAVRAAERSGADAFVTPCPSCTLHLAEYCDQAKFPIYYLSELCQMAIGEKPPNLNVERSKMVSNIVEQFISSNAEYLAERVWPDKTI
jgi:Fe-S oxidoreductase